MNITPGFCCRFQPYELLPLGKRNPYPILSLNIPDLLPETSS